MFFLFSTHHMISLCSTTLACSWLLQLLLVDDSSATTCSSPTTVHMGAVAMKSSSQISHMYNVVAAAAVRH
jgi:hypothetical protein